MGVAINVRLELSSEMAEYLSNANGEFEGIEAYVQDLIRRDIEAIDAVTLANIDELRRAFATPESEYVMVSAADVIARNRLRRRQ